MREFNFSEFFKNSKFNIQIRALTDRERGGKKRREGDDDSTLKMLKHTLVFNNSTYFAICHLPFGAE